MTLVTFNNVTKHYGTQDVLPGISFSIQDREKIGLVGANGAGKTTLLRLLLGEEECSSGTVGTAPELSIGYIPQALEYGDGLTADYLLEAVREKEAALRAAEAALAVTPKERLERALGAYQTAHEEYERAGGHEAADRAERTLESLGLTGAMDRRVDTLSGGEKNVLALAKALLSRPSLLVLDEPGNHLDYIGLAWLERYIAGFQGAVLIVSHNRYLLDRTVGKIFELQEGRLTVYDGNYSAYRMTKLRDAAAQQANWKADRKKLERLEALVKRFEEIARNRPDPAWGKRLRARRTQLEKTRERATERPELGLNAIRVDLSAGRTRADIAVSVSGYSRAFDGRVLFRDASLEIRCGERVALVGPNGSGKTTFIRDLLANASWDDPVFRIGPSLTVGYCAQNQEVLDHDKTVLDEFLSLGRITENEVFTLLSRFLFTRRDLGKRIGSLSGGERNRLQLARAIRIGADFLVLDEPTNHMDIPSCEALEDALAEFEGTVLVVTHDRYFLDKIATSIVEIEECGFRTYFGNFSEFWAEKQAALRSLEARVTTRARQYRSSGSGQHGAGAENGAGAERGGSRKAAAAKTDSGRSARDAEAAERLILELEKEKLGLERRLEAAFSRGDHREGRRLSQELAELVRRLDRQYEAWAGLG